MITKVLSKNNIQYAPCPIRVEALNEKRIERLYSKNSLCYAYSAKGKIFTWGFMPKGLSLECYDMTVDLPEKNKKLAGFSFRDITLSEDSATAISRSVLLTFTIPDIEDQQEDDESSQLQYSRSMTKKNQLGDDQETVISIHAIPVYDGSLVKSENDLAEYLQDNGDLTVELVNDFELPWIQRKASNYPKYKNTRKKKPADGEEDSAEEIDENEEEDQAEDEEEEE